MQRHALIWDAGSGFDVSQRTLSDEQGCRFLTVADTHEYVTLKAEYTPRVIKNMATYRPAVAVMVMQRILPIMLMHIGMATWKARSSVLPA